MNPSHLAPTPAPNLPLGPSGAPADSASDSGISGFAVLVAMSFLCIVTFFALSFIAVWRRSEADSSRFASMPVPTVASESDMQPATPARSPSWRKAIVTIPRADIKTGVLRNAPGFNSAQAAFVPRGTMVDVGQAKTKDGQTWYQVKAEVNGRVYEGWMHSDILVWVP